MNKNLLRVLGLTFLLVSNPINFTLLEDSDTSVQGRNYEGISHVQQINDAHYVVGVRAYGQ